MSKRTVPPIAEVVCGSVDNVTPEQLAARPPKQPRVEVQFLMELHRLGNMARGAGIRNLLRRATHVAYPTFDLVHALGGEGYLRITYSRSNGIHHRRPINRIDLTAQGLKRLELELDHVCNGCAPLMSG